jgi:AhpD family alkylhydroperoxidase
MVAARKPATAKSKPEKPARRRSALARKGRKVRDVLLGPEYVTKWEAMAGGDPFMDAFQDFTQEVCFGALWTRPHFDRKTRAMITLAISGANRMLGAVKAHTRVAMRAGLSADDIAEIFLHVYIYAGAYSAGQAFQAAREEMALIEEERREARAAKAAARRKAAPKARARRGKAA